ncbi:MAG TPA: hypothetical protein VFF06_08795 [Polyangia bacterium]|nr:hypothetical protein [Polyangia bacterium]
MWKKWLIGAALALAPALAAAAKSDAALIQVPPDSRLIGTAVVDEVRQFPEQQNAKKPMERVVGVSAIDRVFESNRPYGDTVSYFDQEFQKGGFQLMARTVTPSSTAWVVKRPDGKIANAIVRNTSPATLEIVEAAAAESTAPMPSK